MLSQSAYFMHRHMSMSAKAVVWCVSKNKLKKYTHNYIFNN